MGLSSRSAFNGKWEIANRKWQIHSLFASRFFGWQLAIGN
jgi:hypothetical protein